MAVKTGLPTVVAGWVGQYSFYRVKPLWEDVREGNMSKLFSAATKRKLGREVILLYSGLQRTTHARRDESCVGWVSTIRTCQFLRKVGAFDWLVGWLSYRRTEAGEKRTNARTVHVNFASH